MLHQGQKLIYRDEVCTVMQILPKYINNEDYYELSNDNDSTLKMKVPVKLKSETMRPLISKSEIETLIEKIPKIDVIEINAWNRGQEYKKLLEDGTHESLIKVIKTTYQRQADKASHKQKANENDKIYFKRAEKRFYNEIAASLEMSFDEAKNYIVEKIRSNQTVNLN